MKASRSTWGPRVWLSWAGLVLGTGLVLGLAVLPPFVSEPWRAALMQGFALACHQLPARSPHLYDVPLAVCDRCIGIYAGLVVGSVVALAVRSGWRRLGRSGRYVLLGALVPLAIDWIGPVLGLWPNTPLSRIITGAVLGVVVASFLAYRLMDLGARASARTASTAA